MFVTTWAIGDVQGCARTLDRLLAELEGRGAPAPSFWFAGDVVNRGTGSLAALRRVIALGARAETVLGNHDLHLLGVYAGVRREGDRDTLTDVLQAPDVDALMAWVRYRPLLVRRGFHAMVHAGLPSAPSWHDIVDAAADASAWLRGPRWREWLSAYFGSTSSGDIAERTLVIARFLTRARMIDSVGGADTRHTGAPEEAPPGLRPWYAARVFRSGDPIVVFGHWAGLGVRSGERWRSLDSGAVWGRCLSALSLGTDEVVSVPVDPTDLAGDPG